MLSWNLPSIGYARSSLNEALYIRYGWERYGYPMITRLQFDSYPMTAHPQYAYLYVSNHDDNHDYRISYWLKDIYISKYYEEYEDIHRHEKVFLVWCDAYDKVNDRLYQCI